MTRPERHAIIDIGSNTIRLAVFEGGGRHASEVYDDKLHAGLGKGVVARGRLEPRAMAAALATLERFAALLRLIQPNSLRVIATAAVREAANGAEFLGRVRALGLPAELLSGEDEAHASGWGVIGSHPGARGLVADLGGGSLELALIHHERVHHGVSFPLGVMRVAAIRAGGRGRLRQAVREALAANRWTSEIKGQQLFLVGGSWRALGRLHALRSGAPFTAPIAAGDARALKAAVRELGPRKLAAMPGISSARAAQLPHAAALLNALVAELGPAEVVVSTTGLREGLLMQAGNGAHLST